MRAQIAPGGPSTAVVTPSVEALASKRRRERPAAGSIWPQAVRLIGRTFVGLPASSWLLIDVTILWSAIYYAFVVFTPYQGLDTP